ncbi:flagellar motor protein MotB [bacterium]|nr:flagellar motor protein MotB [bacterium]
MENNEKITSEDEKEISTWMVTFSDLATLLLTFFVLLLSMSSMDDKTLKSLFTSFTSACGILNFKEYGEVYRPKEVMIEGIYQRLKDNIVIKRADDPTDIPAETGDSFSRESGGQIVIEDIPDGFKLVFGHKLLFQPGSADLTEAMKSVLEPVGRFINSSSYQIYLDGHTDSMPVNELKFESNAELSLARAYNIMEYLINKEGISPYVIALAGYGEYKPVDSNETPAGRGNNRRVDMIFKNKRYF